MFFNGKSGNIILTYILIIILYSEHFSFIIFLHIGNNLIYY